METLPVFCKKSDLCYTDRFLFSIDLSDFSLDTVAFLEILQIFFAADQGNLLKTAAFLVFKARHLFAGTDAYTDRRRSKLGIIGLFFFLFLSEKPHYCSSFTYSRISPG